MSEETKGFPEGKHELPKDVEKNIETSSEVSKPPPMEQRRIKRSNVSSDLAAAFSYKEAPVQFIRLPSRGLLYDGLLPDGKLNVIPMTAREEKLLAGASGDLTEVIDTIFQRCVVMGPDLKPSMFLSSDRFYTLLMLRATSYGQDYTFSVTCDACGFDFTKTVNIPDDFETIYLEDDVQEPFEVVLPMSGKKVGFRLPRGSDEVMIAKYSERMLGGRGKKRTVAKKQGDPAYIYRTALLIETLDNIDVSDTQLMKDKIEFVEKLIGGDSMALQAAIRDNDCGIDTEMLERCPRCNKINEFIMPFTAEFFRPAPGRGE